MATQKARDLVRMAVAKVALMESLTETELDINPKALVVGGGISGMAAARSLSDQGYAVCLVEREPFLGGQGSLLFRTWKGEDVQMNLTQMIEKIQSDPNIDLHLNTALTDVAGFVGNFKSTLSTDGHETLVEHGVAVIATGAFERKPDEYLYGEDDRVLTHLELDQRFIRNDPSLGR